MKDTHIACTYVHGALAMYIEHAEKKGWAIAVEPAVFMLLSGKLPGGCQACCCLASCRVAV
jgi:hypothetical protein